MNTNISMVMESLQGLTILLMTMNTSSVLTTPTFCLNNTLRKW